MTFTCFGFYPYATIFENPHYAMQRNVTCNMFHVCDSCEVYNVHNVLLIVFSHTIKLLSKIKFYVLKETTRIVKTLRN